MLPFRLDSRLVVNIGQPGPDPWFERLPPRPRGRASLEMGSPWLDHHPCVPALSEPKKDLTFRTAAASSSSRKKVST